MKGLVLCNKGIENVVALDVKEIIGKESKIFEGFATFEFDKKEELCELAYLSQSIKKVILVLDEFKAGSIGDIDKKARKIDLKEWLDSEKSFKIDSVVKESKANQDELNGCVGESIIEGIKDYKQKVDLENPDVTVFAFVHSNSVYIGIDFSGKDLSKRNYRIFSSPKNIKSTIAYAIVRISDYIQGEVILDPFCLSGSIPIEAALFQNKYPVRYFEKDDFLFNKFLTFDFEKIDKKTGNDKGNIFAFDSQFRNVDSAKKNAKIAGINKVIKFSRIEAEWLDTKFDKESVDKIVTCLPNITKFSNGKDILNIYQEFFHQAEFILKKKGSIVICTKNPVEVKDCGLKEGFKVSLEKEVWQGKEKLVLVKFGK